MNPITVRRAEERDLKTIADINAAVFIGDRNNPTSALEWATCWYRAFPLYQYFVIESDGHVAGYAGWQVHGGFERAEPVIELDQVGINPLFQGQGLAPMLLAGSKQALIAWMLEKNTRIESHITFVVWAYSLNFNALSVYVKSFGESISGLRQQFGARSESMIRHRVPILMPVRKE